jgi:hypothetical protein
MTLLRTIMRKKSFLVIAHVEESILTNAGKQGSHVTLHRAVVDFQTALNQVSGVPWSGQQSTFLFGGELKERAGRGGHCPAVSIEGKGGP